MEQAKKAERAREQRLKLEADKQKVIRVYACFMRDFNYVFYRR